MAKRLVTVTNIKHDGQHIDANTILDHTIFTPDQLKWLYDAGAIRLEVDPEIIPEEASVAVAIVTNTSPAKVAEKPVVKSTVKTEDTNGKSINK